MAQNITLMGANYSAVPAVTLPKTGGGTASFTDVTDTTATASDVASGKIFYASDGTQTTGTASGGGGSSSWTKIAETTYQVSTTSTSSVQVAMWATGHSEIWTSSAFVWVHIRDTAGKRDGYFYGSDTVFLNRMSNNATNVGGRFRIFYNSNSYSTGVDGGTTGRGVYPLAIWDNGDIEIYARYSGTYSKTIDGTYSVEIYLLTPPFTIFE